MMEHNQRRRLWMLGPMVVVALLSGVLIGKGWERTGHASETYEELRTFSEVLTQVQKNYVDDTKVKDLVQGAIRGMLSTLDPHSAYMTPEMYKEMQVDQGRVRRRRHSDRRQREPVGGDCPDRWHPGTAGRHQSR
jgi:carboxyl-terminal processing protease